MNVKIDLDRSLVTVEDKGDIRSYPMNSPEAFTIVSKIWLRAGWDVKHVYTFTWLGRPIIQLPEDILRIQEVIYKIRPDVIIETGVAHGGSLIFYASLCKILGKGKVIGVDIEIRPHNRKALESHELFEYITLIEGSSIDLNVVANVKQIIRPTDIVMIILDSNHTKAHVLAELNAYSNLVSKDSYVIVCDGIMKDLINAPRSEPKWKTDNPCNAIQEFLNYHPEFRQEQPKWLFNESDGLSENITYWVGGWLKRIK